MGYSWCDEFAKVGTIFWLTQQSALSLSLLLSLFFVIMVAIFIDITVVIIIVILIAIVFAIFCYLWQFLLLILLLISLSLLLSLSLSLLLSLLFVIMVAIVIDISLVIIIVILIAFVFAIFCYICHYRYGYHCCHRYRCLYRYCYCCIFLNFASIVLDITVVVPKIDLLAFLQNSLDRALFLCNLYARFDRVALELLSLLCTFENSSKCIIMLDSDCVHTMPAHFENGEKLDG